MTKPSTITINGKLYDALTGQPLDGTPHSPKAAPPVKAPHHQPPHRAFSDIGPRPAVLELTPPIRKTVATDASLQPIGHKNIHQNLQKSHTLNRKAIKKPSPTVAELATAVTPNHKRSPLISRFGTAQNQTPHTPEPEALAQTEPAVTALHPAVAKALQRQAIQKQASVPVNGKELKEQLIKERLAEVDTSSKEESRQHKRQPRLVTILTTTLTLLILGGYLTYINLPDISMRVAASRAGIDAKMPNYKPDGYSLSGPITYAPGEVAINYKSNTNETGFRLTQKATSWDSQAVLDNYVTKQTDNYLTYQQQGVTVYTFDNKAAWVNGGELFVIEGDATLASEQVLRMATSL